MECVNMVSKKFKDVESDILLCRVCEKSELTPHRILKDVVYYECSHCGNRVYPPVNEEKKKYKNVPSEIIIHCWI
jgi:uncharacterized Zn finger protein